MSDINTDEETVLLARNTTGKNYHTDPDCHYVGPNHNPRRRSIAEAWGYSECDHCKHGPDATYGHQKQSKSLANALRDQRRNE